MNKKSWIITVIVIALLIGASIFFYVRNSSPAPNKRNYEAGKTSTNSTSNQREVNTNQNNESQESRDSSEEQENKENQENSSDGNTKDETTQGVTESESENNPAPIIEEQIATFSTKIYTKDSARQNNISITCNTLNGTIVENGATFSFCNTVGASSTSKGYQKADIFDKNGNKKKGLGGR